MFYQLDHSRECGYTRDKSKRGYERYVGLGILGRNLQVLGKLLLSQEDAGCQAAKSKRKKKAG